MVILSVLSVTEFMKTVEWYWWIGATVILFIIWLFVRKHEYFKLFVYEIVVQAEEEIVGYKKGNERFKFVVNEIQDFIPSSLRWYFTEKRIIDIIEWAVRQMKKNLEKDLLE